MHVQTNRIQGCIKQRFSSSYVKDENPSTTFQEFSPSPLWCRIHNGVTWQKFCQRQNGFRAEKSQMHRMEIFLIHLLNIKINSRLGLSCKAVLRCTLEYVLLYHSYNKPCMQFKCFMVRVSHNGLVPHIWNGQFNCFPQTKICKCLIPIPSRPCRFMWCKIPIIHLDVSSFSIWVKKTFIVTKNKIVKLIASKLKWIVPPGWMHSGANM